jgi:hypothetical protein
MSYFVHKVGKMTLEVFFDILVRGLENGDGRLANMRSAPVIIADEDII